MQYPTPNKGVKLSLEEKANTLTNIRHELEYMAQVVVNAFGVDKQTDDVIRHLKGARMDLGNLFERTNVEDLNRKRDKKEPALNPKKK